MVKTIYYKSKCFWYCANFLLILFVCCFLLSCNKTNSEIRVLFVGDILLSRNVRTEFQTRNTFPWENLKSYFQSADLLVGNLEGAVGKSHGQSYSNDNSPIFAIDSSDIHLLRDAGFKIITIENNHSLDLGINGKRKTIKALQNFGIIPVSLDNSPQFYTIKDVVIAILSFNIVLSRDSTKNQIPSIEIKQKLQLAKSLASIVIVSIHWGSELLDWPSKEQRETAKWLIKNGADIIIGSHPHVIQKPEIIEGKPVFFSLGNHLFDQKYVKTKEGLIVDIRIYNGKFRCEGIVTHTKQNSFYPEIIKQINFGFKSIKLTNTDFRINDYIIKPLSFIDSSGNKIVLQAYKNNHMNWNTHPMPIISITTGRLNGKNDYLFILEKHFSNFDKEINIRPYVYNLDNKGIYACWRGSALAWPILDAVISPDDNKTLCVLHRGDSFIKIDKTKKNKRVAAYKWNGFGFTGIDDSIACESCIKLFEE